ncbi:hypothetical protein [Nocardia sp. NPDC050793]|uniref:hypothetical protein n=1 Tax=Nocardia sp. NPDC050793 TaxID=3155159 RepID=UPI0033CFF582
MRGLSQRKPPPPPSPQVAVGYFNTRLVPTANIALIGARMRHRAEGWGYAWGGTYLDHRPSSDTVDALIRRAARDPDIWVIVVPDHAHLPAGRALLCTGTSLVRVVDVGSDDGTPRPPQQIPAYP